MYTFSPISAVSEMNEGCSMPDLFCTKCHKALQQSRKCHVWILATQQSCRDGLLWGKIAGHDDCACLRLVDEVLVLGIGKKSQAAGATFLDLCQAADPKLGLAFHLRTDHACDFSNLKFHVSKNQTAKAKQIFETACLGRQPVENVPIVSVWTICK